MEDILQNDIRVGRITSSQVYKLMGAPKPRKTYIKELIYERKMGRKLGMGKSTNATSWGLFMERFVHERIGLDYITDAQTTMPHPCITGWCGSPDTTDKNRSVVSDIKCFEPLNFCQYIEVLEQGVEAFKLEYPKEYWQLISNAILTGMDNIEAIVYMPYQKDLEDIRNEAAAYDEHDAYKYRFIYELPWYQLACLPDGSGYKDLNIFTFAAPQEDKELLTKAVEAVLKEVDSIIPIYNTDAHGFLETELS